MKVDWSILDIALADYQDPERDNSLVQQKSAVFRFKRFEEVIESLKTKVQK